MNLYEPAKQPTIYFIGVTTSHSSIMKVFPKWAELLGLEGAVIKGFDFPLHDTPEAYREAVNFIKNDPFLWVHWSPHTRSTYFIPAGISLISLTPMPASWGGILYFQAGRQTLRSRKRSYFLRTGSGEFCPGWLF